MRTKARREEVAKRMAQSDYGIDWAFVLEEYAGDDEIRRMHVVMATLRVSANWTYDQIGRTMGLSRGHVCRVVQDVLTTMKIAALETALAGESKPE